MRPRGPLPDMTKADIEKQVKHWQKLLRLQDWDVTVETVICAVFKEDDYGEVTINRNKLTAHIKVATDREELAVRKTTCHEVCHLLVDGPWAAHLRAIQGLGREARQLSEDTYREQEEQLIRRLVDALCPQ